MSTSSGKAPPAACVFDAYGTIFDFASAVRHRAAAVGDSAPTLIETWRSKQLQYTWLRSLQGQYVNFEQVTADALAYALEAMNIKNEVLHDERLALYHTLDAFPDAVSALRQLRTAGTAELDPFQWHARHVGRSAPGRGA